VREPARARLAVYQRQYWFRLFTALQLEFRLTARLMSFWVFNDYASRFLLAQPPRSADLHRAADGLDAFLEQELPEDGVESATVKVPRRALLEAVRIDQAHRQVFAAPLERPFRMTAKHGSRIASLRLRMAPSVVLLEEHWPLLALRRQLAREDDAHPVALPAALAARRCWALFRTEHGFGAQPLSPDEARLLSLLREHSVGESLARLEHEVDADARAALAGNVTAWLSESVRLGFWTTQNDDAADGEHA
jgi:hypothetical protein